MLLNDVQDRVEKSIYEAIRLVLVREGYLPDITDPAYPNTVVGSDQFQADLKAIENAKSFAAEVFGHSSSLSKGLKRVPRIAIIPRRLMPGNIGQNIRGGFSPNPLDPDSTVKKKPILLSADLHIDINVISASAEQDRFLHAVLAEAISLWKYIPMYDNPSEVFFIRQFNFYDLPDDKNGIEEKVYSYEVPDLYLSDEVVSSNVARINQITVNTTPTELSTIYVRTGSLIGPFIDGDVIYIDLSGIKFKIP